MKQWEYKTVKIKAESESWIKSNLTEPVERKLNSLGLEGWELVSTHLWGDNLYAILKRPILG